MTTPLGLGVVGAGGFATFLTDAIADLPDVAVHHIADPRPQAAQRLARAHSARHTDDWEQLLDDDRVDALVVATPPSGHADIASASLQAGRHVFCEKPLALDEATAMTLVQAVNQTGLVLVVDHVLRYNPILHALRRLRGTLLGPLQRFCLENDASDEDLHDDHWFWDRRLSGGIFVEHGVHFFDAAAMLTDHPATSVQAMNAHRTGGPVDMVTATVRHGCDVLATHTHSFTHAHRCERQLMRLDYGPAEARVEGWIPVRAVIDVWTDGNGASFAESLPETARSLLRVEGYRLGERADVLAAVERDATDRADARGRGTVLDIPHHVRLELTLGGPVAKAEVYAESVRAAMTDFASSIRRGSTPFSGVHEAATAVAVADAATRSADEGCLVTLEEETS